MTHTHSHNLRITQATVRYVPGKNDTHTSFVSSSIFCVQTINTNLNHHENNSPHNTSITTGTDRDVAGRELEFDIVEMRVLQEQEKGEGRCVELACCHEFSFLLYFYRMEDSSRGNLVLVFLEKATAERIVVSSTVNV